MNNLTVEKGIFLINSFEPGFQVKKCSEISFKCENGHLHSRPFYRIIQNINKNGGKFFCQTCAMHTGSIKGTSADTSSKYIKDVTTERFTFHTDPITGEQWVKISPPFDNYAVSSFGKVQNTITKKTLLPEVDSGYNRIVLSSHGTKAKMFVHRLVASAFLPNPDSDDQVFINHKDADKLNNVVSNLEWCSQRQNMTQRTKETQKRDVGYTGTELLQGEVEWRSLQLKNGKNIEISNTGLIRTEKLITNGHVKQHGYRLFNDFAIHRLVAEAFLGLPPNHEKLIVNHKNGNKEDNRAINLEWITHAQNSKHASDSGLMDGHKRRIRQYDLSGMFIKDYPSQAEASRDLGCVSEDAINYCLRGCSMSAGNFIWRYADVEDVPMAVNAVVSGKCKVEKCLLENDQVVETFESITESITEAAEKLGISFTQIKRMIDTGKSINDNLHFLRCSDEGSDIRKERAKPRKVERLSADGLSVIGTWQSMKKAAKDVHLGENTVKKFCETQGKDKEGFLWRFA